MKRSIKKFLKIVWLTFVALTAVFLAAILAIQLPQVQTYVSEKVAGSLAGKLDGDISFDKIHLKPFNALVIKNLTVTDRNPVIEGADTLFRAEYIIARFSFRGLFGNNGLHIGRTYVSNAEMMLVVEEDRVNLTRIFRIPPPPEVRKKNDRHVFDIRRASIYNMKFRLRNSIRDSLEYTGYGIDWNDIEVNDINIEARRLDLTGNVMTGVLDFMSFTEKSGYVCNSLSGKATVGNGKSIIEEIRLSDPWSDIYIPSYVMSYARPDYFADYVSKIRMDGRIGNTALDMKTLSYFASGLEGIAMKSELSGKISGTVDDLTFRDMDISTSDGMKLVFGGRLSGLPDMDRAKVSLEIEEMKTTSESLDATIRSFSGGTETEIGKWAKGVDFTLKGKAEGSPDDLNADLSLYAGSGYLGTVMNIRNLLSDTDQAAFSGRIRTHDLDLGDIIGSDILHQCSMRASFSADLGTDGTGPAIAIDSLFIDRLNFNGYDYSRIAAAGTMTEHKFDGRLVSYDPNLSFMFQGIFSFSPKTSNSVYKFYANVGYADLYALNIDKRGVSKVSFQASANFNRQKAGDILGSMKIGDVVLENDLGEYKIGDVSVRSYFGDDLYRMKLTSSFADASFAGTGQITEFISDLNNITLKRELPALFRDSTRVRHDDRYRITFNCKNSIDLLAFVSPGLYIADSTSLDIRIDTAGVFRAGMTSPRIAYRENYIKGMDMRLDNINGSLGGEITGDIFNIATLALENNSFKIFAKDNFVGLGYSYDNPGNLINRGEAFITSDIMRDSTDRLNFHIEMLPSRILLNSREWNIGTSAVDISGSDINVRKIEFTSGDQSVRVTGGYSASRRDTLTLRLERFDISVINPLLKNRFGIEGAVTGQASIFSPSDEKEMSFRFLSDSTRISGSDIGTMLFTSEWNDRTNRFDAHISNEIAGARTFDISGSYVPSKKMINADAVLSGMDISYAGPFLTDIFSDMSGHLSGRISATGTPDNLHVTSENTRIDDSELRIAFTNVPYKVNGDFRIDDNGIFFDDIAISDRHGNSGRITGGLKYDRFRNMVLDAAASVTDMECLNTTEDDNSSFYGNLSASGNISLSGPLNGITMNVAARTSGEGQIHIPIPSSATAVSSNLLTFKEIEKEVYVDPYDIMMNRISKTGASSGEFKVRLDVEATPEIEVFVEIDKASGNVLRGRGAGNIELETGGDEFNILGDYTLTSGSYRFVAQGLAYRDFTISDGSSIKFNGDIMESDLDIDAIYRTKTSLATLIADTSSVSTRRTVDCGIRISDKLKNPRLAFSIDIPDIDPTIKSRVESALSTEDKVQKQFLSLIVFNSFLPDDQSGIVNNASMLYTTVTGIMYNQLNNIFQKLDIPLDLGLNYQPNERGEDIFDVAVSTQLFNNRVVVNGNLGNRQYTSGYSNSDVVGDLDIEIKLDRPGLFRLNIFSHSADQYTNYLDDSQRNGIGIAYQQEFNTFREFFTNLFTGRKKRRSQAAAGEAVQEKKTIRITAENDERQ